MSEKVVGYGLLAVGIFLILFSVFNVYSVFTGKVKPYPLFNLPGISLDFTNLVGSDLSPQQREQLRESKNLKSELVSADVLNEPLNLFAYVIFMGFVANIGFKIASIGVQFLRPIKVNLREQVQAGVPKT